jgi:hypothetical protein
MPMVFTGRIRTESKPRRVPCVLPDLTTIGEDAQDYILGYSQPSPSTGSGQALRDWSVVSNFTQDSRPGLLSVVPTGLNSKAAAFTQLRALIRGVGKVRLESCPDSL